MDVTTGTVFHLDVDKFKAWMRNEEKWDSPVESAMTDEDFCHPEHLTDVVADDLSNLLASMPTDVLTPDPTAIQIDPVYDEYGYQCRVVVTLANGVNVAGSVEELRHVLPHEVDLRDGTVEVDEQYPQLPRIVHTLQQVVRIANHELREMRRFYVERAEPLPVSRDA